MAETPEKPVIVLGAGGHASVLVDCLLGQGKRVLGLVDSARKTGEKILGLDILGGDEIILEYPPEKVVLINGVGAVQYATQRWDLACRMRKAGYNFLTLIHSAAIVGANVRLDEGVQIMAGAVIQPGTTVGRDSIVNTGALIDHDCIIGSDCHICPGATLAGSVRIGDRSMICSGATIIPNISIGKGTTVAAGAVVYRNIDSGITYIQQQIEKETEGMHL